MFIATHGKGYILLIAKLLFLCFYANTGIFSDRNVLICIVLWIGKVVIEDQKMPYHLGSAMKYICRAGKKDPAKTVEDLQKAVWYINRYIGLLGKETAK